MILSFIFKNFSDEDGHGHGHEDGVQEDGHEEDGTLSLLRTSFSQRFRSEPQSKATDPFL